MQGLYTPQRHYRHRCHSLQQHSTGGNSQGHRSRYRMYSDEDLFSDFTLGITITDTDPQMVINSFVTHWVWGQCGDGFGLPRNYIFTIFTSTGQQLDTIEGRQICEKLGLTWKYPSVNMVISLTPMDQIFSDLKCYKVKTADTPVETLLSEAVFSSNSRANKHTKLTPFQLVTGQQPLLPPK